jgi:hypothetical protein
MRRLAVLALVLLAAPAFAAPAPLRKPEKRKEPEKVIVPKFVYVEDGGGVVRVFVAPAIVVRRMQAPRPAAQ